MSTIVDLQGNPISSSSEPEKRYAIVGSVNIHYAVYELKPGEDEAHALRTHNLLCGKNDPVIKQITQTERFYWCEDDRTRPLARHGICKQIISFFANLLANGDKQKHTNPYELAESILKNGMAGLIKPETSQEKPHGQN